MELGLIDEIGGLSDALTCLHKMIEQRNREEPAGLRDDSRRDCGMIRLPDQPRRMASEGGRGRRAGPSAWKGGQGGKKFRKQAAENGDFFQMRAEDSEKNKEKREQNHKLTSKNAL